MRVGTILAALTLTTAALATAEPRQAAAASPRQTPPALAALREGINRIAAREPAAAEAAFQRAVELARREGDRLIEARALRGVGVARLNQASYPAAKEALQLAVQIFEQLDSKADLAASLNELGNAEHYLDREAARRAYRRALGVFASLGDVREQANVYYNLSLDLETSDRAAVLQAGLALAERIGDGVLIGGFLHSWSDTLFQQGRLADAMEKVEAAIGHLTRTGDAGAHHLATALTSLGRLHRAHGQHDRALEAYRRAFTIQEGIGDRFGMMQSLNAIAVACGYLGRWREAGRYFEQAVELAGRTGTPSLVAWTTGNLAGFLIRRGEAQRALAMLQALTPDPEAEHERDTQLASAYLALGQYARAAEHAGRAARAMRERGLLDRQYSPLVLHARALDRLGRTAEAVSDARDAVDLIDRIRADAVATDAMKLAFSGEHQEVFALAIELLIKAGRPRDALDLAERARGRAFADLLASRDAWTPGGAAPEDSSRTGLRSLASIAPLTAAGLAHVAAERRSTILAYWVAADATYVWVVHPEDRVAAVRVDITAAKVTELVRQAASIRASVRPSRDNTAAARLRGEGLLALGAGAIDASRRLFELLIKPVEGLLPGEPGSLLTVIPHGPLFMLSFGSLQDPGGRYLLEHHAIHYVPAGVVLQLTGERTTRTAPAEPKYLLVGDPRLVPAGRGGRLPPLPGARQEVRQVARQLSGARVTALVGAQATESEVRRAADGASVIHLATHGVLSSEDPLESFLAFGQQASVGAPVPAEGDGRLTVREIYDLRLRASLVVLSACGTGLGQVSGDGVAGLARAFVYAGSPSVVATLWDLADEPAARLVPAFYRSLQKGADKASALRQAQLRLLADLRAGRVTVPGRSGQVTLAEHPLLWAGFILIGEP